MRPSELLRGLGQPASYYPEMRKITGSLTSTIFFFNFYYWTGSEKSQDGWIYKSTEQIEKETGLTYDEQRGARMKLKKLGLIEEHYRRFEHLMYYRVRLDMFDHLWVEVYGDSQIRELGNSQMGDMGNSQFDPIYPLLTTLNNKGTVEKASKKKKETIDYQAFMDTWNANTEGTFPKITSIAGKRASTIATRLKSYPNLLEMMVPVINYISGIEFFTGKNDRGWVASFDYLMQDGKILELYEKAIAAGCSTTREPDALDIELAQMEREYADARR